MLQQWLPSLILCPAFFYVGMKWGMHEAKKTTVGDTRKNAGRHLDER